MIEPTARGNAAETAAETRKCPFCETLNVQSLCKKCGRDVTAPRRLCTHCQRMTPMNEENCAHCKARQTSDLRWKVPLIVGIFLLAFILSIILHSL